MLNLHLLTMPAAFDIDRESVKTLCVAIGVRAAARKLNLPEDTVRQWSCRGKWFSHHSPPPPKPQPPTVLQPKTDAVTNVTTPSETLKNALEADSRASKIGLSAATRRAADAFAKKKGSSVIKQAQQLRHVVAAAATLHGWTESKETGLTVNLGVVLNGME